MHYDFHLNFLLFGKFSQINTHLLFQYFLLL